MGREIRYGLASAIQDGSIDAAKLVPGSITNTQISASAAIASSKLTGDTQGLVTVTPNETIAQYKLVMYGDGSAVNLLTQTSGASASTFGDSAALSAYAQSFAGADVAESFGAVVVSISKIGSPTDNITLKVRSGSQTGTLLATASINGAAITGSLATYTLTLDTPVTPVSGTQYFLVMERSGAVNGGAYYAWATNASSVYANGVASYYNGSVWGDQAAQEKYFILQKVYTTTRVYNAKATTAAFAARVLGIAATALTNGVAGSIQADGIVTNVGWNWTPGVTLYASDTAGAISETAGTVSKPIGRAVTATQVKLDFI